MWWGLYSYCYACYLFSFNPLIFYFQIAVKSCKQVSRNISEMSKELEAIGQVTNVGELPGKLQEVEEAKVEVENQLLERVSKFGCSDHLM